MTATGYLHRDYALSLAQFGRPRLLPRSQGWILERPIPEAGGRDAMGLYPLFCCRSWDTLDADLEALAGDLVSLSLVSDPFADVDRAALERCFPDVARPFKEHFVVDLSRTPEHFVSDHHRRNVEQALDQVHVERVDEPAARLDDWTRLYDTLIRRHNISGITAFSREAFALQLQVPGVAVFRGVHQEKTVSMLIWYRQGDVAYYHLGAHSALGYDLVASFALFWKAIDHFRAQTGIRWLNLGAGAGARGDADDGLSRFKRGWATGTRTAYFCGRVFNRHQYEAAIAALGVGETDYFPAYRQGEF